MLYLLKFPIGPRDRCYANLLVRMYYNKLYSMQWQYVTYNQPKKRNAYLDQTEIANYKLQIPLYVAYFAQSC